MSSLVPAQSENLQQQGHADPRAASKRRIKVNRLKNQCRGSSVCVKVHLALHTYSACHSFTWVRVDEVTISRWCNWPGSLSEETKNYLRLEWHAFRRSGVYCLFLPWCEHRELRGVSLWGRETHPRAIISLRACGP